MTTRQEAHEMNLDAAQREIDMRAAEGEDMARAFIDLDYRIRFVPEADAREAD